MLLAVEGGGFFSSSASGYSKGLTLLLLGHRNDDKPMRVTPWNRYQLVDQESDPDFQLASYKNRVPRGCASFLCFGGTSAGLDSPSHLKVGPAQQQDVLPDPLDSVEDNGHITTELENNTVHRKVTLKSSLKKTSNSISALVEDVKQSDELSQEDPDIRSHTGRRNVQWTDTCGHELAEIREFEPSETGFSDDDYENKNERSCQCVIM